MSDNQDIQETQDCNHVSERELWDSEILEGKATSLPVASVVRGAVSVHTEEQQPAAGGKKRHHLWTFGGAIVTHPSTRAKGTRKVKIVAALSGG